jgi:hypothetical protein
MPRIQAVIIPLLRDDPKLAGVKIGSWIEDIDFREFPMLNIRRAGAQAGAGRDWRYPNKLDITVIEMTAYSDEGLIECEHLYNIALEALYDAVHFLKQTDAGYLHSIKENMGMTQFSSKFMDSWRVQGLIRLGLRSKSVLH